MVSMEVNFGKIGRSHYLHVVMVWLH